MPNIVSNPNSNAFSKDVASSQIHMEDIEISHSFNFSNDRKNIEAEQPMNQGFTNTFNYNAFEMTSPEEVDAARNRRAEEEKKIKQLMEKQSKESNDKRDMKNKAREFLDNFNQKRQKANEMKHKANSNEEQLLIEYRQNSKTDQKNPWDKVVSLIDLRESEYKGSKNIERMRKCIITRRQDVAKALEKK